MSEDVILRPIQRLAGWVRRVRPLIFTFLIIEFYDEASYAIGGAAMSAIRTDLGLSLAQVGQAQSKPWMRLVTCSKAAHCGW